jgi:hypothetical protein
MAYLAWAAVAGYGRYGPMAGMVGMARRLKSQHLVAIMWCIADLLRPPALCRKAWPALFLAIRAELLPLMQRLLACLLLSLRAYLAVTRPI